MKIKKVQIIWLKSYQNEAFQEGVGYGIWLTGVSVSRQDSIKGELLISKKQQGHSVDRKYQVEANDHKNMIWNENVMDPF